jgi:hypothetical protein
MGVRGLLRALQSLYGSVEPCCSTNVDIRRPGGDVTGTTLLIDANGFMFFLLDSKAGIQRVKREYGGCYDAYDALIRREIERLEAFGFKLRFYVDGSAFEVKAHTAEDRIAQREVKWSYMYNYCNGRYKDLVSQLPKPPLMGEQYFKTLEAIGADIVFCEREADQELALECHRRNQQLREDCGNENEPESTFCYGFDSDFLLLKDCPYIPFGKINIQTGFAAEVWRRRELATHVEMTEAQLVEWAILIGNDFTEHFDRCMFSNLPRSCRSGHKPEVIEELRELIVEMGEGFEIASEDPDLQEAINFSRICYQLGDLSEFGTIQDRGGAGTSAGTVRDWDQDENEKQKGGSDAVNGEENETGDVDEEEEEYESIMALSQAQVDFLNDWGRGPETTGCKLIEDVGLGAAVVSMLTTASTWLVSENPFSLITTEHLEGLTLMLHVLNDQLDCSEFIDQLTTPPVWEDFYAGHFFQLICRHFHKKSGHQPKDYFNGAIYHVLMKEKRVTATPVEPPVIGLDAEDVVGDEVDEGDWESVASDNEGDAEVVNAEVLPIDRYRDEILAKIRDDRVVIIHGETGSGKSSRIPSMILEEAEAAGDHCRIFMSQPRRIAVMGLLNRLRPTLGRKVRWPFCD